MTTRIGMAGVPTSAGSHNPGQEDAPAAWRAAGVLEALTAAGIDVRDYGDLAPRPFHPGPAVRRRPRPRPVIDVCRQTAALPASSSRRSTLTTTRTARCSLLSATRWCARRPGALMKQDSVRYSYE
jgi:hypothetical protein